LRLPERWLIQGGFKVALVVHYLAAIAEIAVGARVGYGIGSLNWAEDLG
jgi:hypothetical protein